MRILVLGAGAIGGYYGGRLVEGGADVTFLVRPAGRSVWLSAASSSAARSAISSARSRRRSPARSATADLVLLSCKAYDLDGAIEAIAPALGTHGAVLPLLNGINHMAVLAAASGSSGCSAAPAPSARCSSPRAWCVMSAAPNG